MGQTLSQVFPPTSKFSVNDIPDLSGKVMIVTGGYGGIGKETVRALLNHNAKVYLAGRNSSHATAAIEELKKDTGKDAVFLQLDLASLKSVKRAADEFLSKEQQLDALFNLGGIMYLTNSPGNLDLTEEGFDIQWGTNLVGPYYFTKLLLPALLAAAKSSPDKKVHVTFTASQAQEKQIKFDTLTDTPERKKLGPDARYGQSKMANVVISKEFARRFSDQGLVAFSLNPGGIKTPLQRNLPSIFRTLLSPLLYPPPMGALTHLWGVTSADSSYVNGQYLIPWARKGTALPESQDPKLGEQLWKWLEEHVDSIPL
ncbi:NAD-binding protein [Cristinia sonorae]|uniref:NAD-binding protein n=1 Tax=Cristinia sonorae TaxID=1940300 RepID=A0A8K0XR79_9AGAR|nr:NAD-binding protein [Cristinia sonorae]